MGAFGEVLTSAKPSWEARGQLPARAGRTASRTVGWGGYVYTRHVQKEMTNMEFKLRAQVTVRKPENFCHPHPHPENRLCAVVTELALPEVRHRIGDYCTITTEGEFTGCTSTPCAHGRERGARNAASASTGLRLTTSLLESVRT